MNSAAMPSQIIGYKFYSTPRTNFINKTAVRDFHNVVKFRYGADTLAVQLKTHSLLFDVSRALHSSHQRFWGAKIQFRSHLQTRRPSTTSHFATRRGWFNETG